MLLPTMPAPMTTAFALEGKSVIVERSYELPELPLQATRPDLPHLEPQTHDLGCLLGLDEELGRRLLREPEHACVVAEIGVPQLREAQRPGDARIEGLDQEVGQEVGAGLLRECL